jgi:hypothetical protein
VFRRIVLEQCHGAGNGADLILAVPVEYRDLRFAARDPVGHCGQLSQRPGDAAHAYDGELAIAINAKMA